MPDNPKAGIVVLISGNGSNLQAVIDHAAKPGCPYAVSAVISNRAGAYGLQRAQQAGIPHHTIEHKRFPDRETFDRAMIDCIDRYQPQLLVLAGYMRILTAGFVRHYEGRMLNIHPSLLPKYRGLHTHQRAIEAGDTRHGLSIHFVTEELDSGPLILQAALNVRDGDTAESLAKRVLTLEHIYYPQVIAWYAERRLSLQNKKVVFDNRILETPIEYSAA